MPLVSHNTNYRPIAWPFNLYNLRNPQIDARSCVSIAYLGIYVSNWSESRAPVPTMGHPEANTNPGADISAPIIPREPDLERNLEKVEDVEIVTEIGEQNGVETTESTPKKSLSFKLAFVGLAAILFVFQLDATCLGIALPVSHDTIIPDMYAAWVEYLHINTHR